MVAWINPTGVLMLGRQGMLYGRLFIQTQVQDTLSALSRTSCCCVGNRFLPKDLQIIGYARSKLTAEDLREKLKGYLKGEDDLIGEFLGRVTYISGVYDGDEGFQACSGPLHGCVCFELAMGAACVILRTMNDSRIVTVTAELVFQERPAAPASRQGCLPEFDGLNRHRHGNPMVFSMALQGLQKGLEQREQGHDNSPVGRLFYLALPPSVYPQARRSHPC